MITDNLGGRKFIFAILAVVLGFVLVLADRIVASDFLTFVGVVGATYVLGNVLDQKN
jgi:hypothetical protein